MPEGDTIHRAAKTLARVLVGQRVVDAAATVPSIDARTLIGREVLAVKPRGKNLLVHFDDGRALHTHMRMTGSWHVYRPGEPWLKPPKQARITLRTDAFVAVCFNAPVVALLSASELRRDRHLSTLGPDMLGETLDVTEVVRRLRARESSAIGEALMLQHLLAGIGNVYKSELLFMTRADPFRTVREFTDEALAAIVELGREVMQENVEHERMRTTRHALGGSRFWVYGRSGEPCYTCGTKIRMRRQGDAGRSTYFCPACQHVRLGSGSSPLGAVKKPRTQGQ